MKTQETRGLFPWYIIPNDDTRAAGAAYISDTRAGAAYILYTRAVAAYVSYSVVLQWVLNNFREVILRMFGTWRLDTAGRTLAQRSGFKITPGSYSTLLRERYTMFQYYGKDAYHEGRVPLHFTKSTGAPL